jgi:8-amino-7-oxononanoate synthase
MPLPNKWAFAQKVLADRDHHHRRRHLTPLIPLTATQIQKGNQTLLNFSSNDYLGLSKHPALLEAASQALQRYGTSATASRLVAGTYDIHTSLEIQLAQAVGKEAALLFGTGFQCNATVIPTLVDRHSLILADRLIHNSLIQGALASGARFLRFPHNDLTALEAQLQKAQAQQTYNRILLLSETVFSMDGDRCDLEGLVALAQRYDAMLYLDDAHALGVLGPQGMGLAAHQPGVDFVVGTFGKAFGAFGAFIACSALLRDYLVNVCPGLIYTTALPPAVVGTIAAALDLVPRLEAERGHLAGLADQLRLQLGALGYDTAGSRSQIVPAIVGAEDATLALAGYLERSGILATAIRPPTVAVNTARLRLTLSSAHQFDDLDTLITVLSRFSWGR